MQWQCWWGGSGPLPARPSGRQALPPLLLLFKPGYRSLPALVRDIDGLLPLPFAASAHYHVDPAFACDPPLSFWYETRKSDERDSAYTAKAVVQCKVLFHLQ